MTGIAPYVHLPGTARAALEFYARVFDGTAGINTYAEFGRADGPGEYVAHGMLADSAVALFAADVVDDQALQTRGLMLSLLGTAEPDVMRGWFAGLAEGGRVVDDLQKRPWGDYDGQVIDRFGLHWLIGFQGD